MIRASSASSRSRLVVEGARRALAEAWSLIAPVDCAGCGAADRALCPSCTAQLRSRPMLGRLELTPPTALPIALAQALPIAAALPYDGVVRRAVLALKEQGRTELARSLADLMNTAVDIAWQGSRAHLLVPVPGGWAAAGRRGFDPVRLIAQRAGLITAPALRAARPREAPETAPQKSRTLAQRLAGDAPLWRVSPRVRGHRVVIVDDVVTSGATLRAAARALTAAGAEVAGCAVIAATPRRVGASSIPWRFLSNADQGPDDNGPREDYREGKEA